MSEIAVVKQSNAVVTTPSRRGFLASALAAALGVSLADIIHPGELSAAPPDCSKAGDAFVPVREFVSKNKTLSANMTVKTADKSIATIAGQGYQCRSMKVRYYEGQDLNDPAVKWPVNPLLPGPGPTLRVKVGDRVHVLLHNAINPADFAKTTVGDMACNVKTQLDPTTGASKAFYPQDDTPPSCLHGDNLTNLHYHGTHVTPDGHGDNVMVDVHPIMPPKFPKGETYLTDFTIPLPPPAANSTNHAEPFKMGQAPGTHWYHAHKHGSVALQLLNGMAGALIIEGEFDEQLESQIPGLSKTEKVLVIQQLGDTIMIQPGTPLNTCAGGDPLPLVNGQLQPTIEMKPGEIQRWRLVNATMQQVAHLTYRFLSEDVYNASKGGPFPSDPGNAPTIRQIAYDGIQLAPKSYTDANAGQSQEFTIAPGNRIDILVKAPATPGKSVLAFRMLHVPPAGCPVPATIPDLILVRLNVAGSAVSPPMNFPTDHYPEMPAWLQWDESDPRNKILTIRKLEFNNSLDASLRPAIDNKAYDGTLATTQLINLDTAEEWILENWWASSIHPFHIHVNPFQVLEVFDPNVPTQVTLQAPYNWRDTIAIPAAKVEGATTTPGRVRIRSRFVDFPGTFVLHCHILDHEDRGMMQKVQVLDPKAKNVKPTPEHH